MAEYRYLPGSKVKHELVWERSNSSRCGIVCIPASVWMGTGSQMEYETAQRLPLCKNCERSKP